mgnify:CR=1 FL=1
MKTISFYDANGRITHVLTASDPVVELNKSKDHRWIDGEWDDDMYYIKDGRPVKRLKNPCVVEGQSLLNVPVPSVIWVNQTRYDCDDSTVELEFNQPGTYTVRVQSWPYLDTEFEIENQAP